MFLLDEPGQRVLPIWIGQFEGLSIAMGVRDVDTVRPMTFSFISNLLETLGAQLEEARVEALRGETFFGVAKLRLNGGTREVDARPSDILALAARTGSPIYVSDEVMQIAGLTVRSGIDMPEPLQDESEIPPPTGTGLDALIEEVERMLQSVPPCSEEP